MSYAIQYVTLKGEIIWSPMNPRPTLAQALKDVRQASVGWRILNEAGEIEREWFDPRLELPALHGPYTGDRPQ